MIWKTVLSKGTEVASVLADAVFPRFCVRCGKEGSLLCKVCSVDWQPDLIKETCFICKESSVYGVTHAVCGDNNSADGVFSSFHYADPIVRKLVQAWKYHFDQTAWEHLKEIISRQDHRIQEIILKFEIDAIVPVSLHDKRLCERGFDQSELLADFFEEKYFVQKRLLLKRVHATGKQAERTPEQRLQVMYTSPFSIPKNKILPAHVLLVDDVWTTGSTAMAAVRILKQAGVKKVWVYTIAQG